MIVSVVHPIPEQPFVHPLEHKISRGSAVVVDPISYERKGTLVDRSRIVAKYPCEEGDLVVPFLIGFNFCAPRVAIGVTLIVRGPLYVVIEVGPFHHAREIDRHPIKYDSALGIIIDMFVATSGDGGGGGHQLRND